MSEPKALMQSLIQRFDAEAAQDLEAVFQYELEGALFYLDIRNQTCQVQEGEAEDPTVTLRLDRETLEEVMSGDLDGMQAFMQGRLRVEGDMMLATRLSSLFPVP